MWSIASQGQQASLLATRLDRKGDMTMSIEGETELHRKHDQEEETE